MFEGVTDLHWQVQDLVGAKRRESFATLDRAADLGKINLHLLKILADLGECLFCGLHTASLRVRVGTEWGSLDTVSSFRPEGILI